MELVVDANVVISALIKGKQKTSELLFSDRVNLFAPEFLFEEIQKHKKDVQDKTGLPESELDTAISIIKSRIKLVPFSEFRNQIEKAKETCPDPDDNEYMALSIKLKCPLWSNDKRLKSQNEVKVINTSELLAALNEDIDTEQKDNP
jgi:predicted nucleic acid-binding protein